MRKYILAFLVAGFAVTGAQALEKSDKFVDRYPQATEFQMAQAGPVTSVPQVPAPSTTTTTVVKGGTWAAAVLEWFQVAFVPAVGAAIIAALMKVTTYFGVQTTETQRGQLQDIIVNGLNSAAAKAQTDLRSTDKLDFQVKSQIVNDAIQYAQDHGGATIKALGLDPNSGDAVEAIRARIETALNDPATPTPAAITPDSGMPAQPLAPGAV